MIEKVTETLAAFVCNGKKNGLYCGMQSNFKM